MTQHIHYHAARKLRVARHHYMEASNSVIRTACALGHARRAYECEGSGELLTHTERKLGRYLGL
jgi:hypothetical protein